MLDENGNGIVKQRNCWMFSNPPPSFILLGRFGDIIQMLPCFKAVHDRTNTKPVIVSSLQYGSILDGVSYVEPYLIRQHWYMGVPAARVLAEAQFGGAVVPQWWADDERAKQMDEATKGPLVVQCHGHNWGVDIGKWPDYGTSMAERCGFKRDEWIKLPLVFDKRDYKREADLIKRYVGGDNRPLILYNLTGNSSPFGWLPEVQNELLKLFSKQFKILNLGPIHAHRIYDLLGLYDRAVGLITSDTSTLHLAPASNIPYVAFTVGGWTQSVPKGRCELQITYNDVMSRIHEVWTTIVKWKAAADANRS